jgi:hypothetical protein
MGRRMDGSDRSEASPATTYSVFTADGSMARTADACTVVAVATSPLTKMAFSWKLAGQNS